jgi:Zn-finger nucleic acid-binding protein
MKCPRCAFDIGPVGQQDQCTRCGYPLPKEGDEGVVIVGGKVEASCPICAVPLLAAQIEEETVAHCGQCRGILVEMESFRVIVTRRRSLHGSAERCTEPFDPTELQRVLTCPRCHLPMDAHPYFGGGNVIVDSCEPCGVIWLDAGKSALIERYLPYVHQIERTLTLRGGRYQGGPRDMPSLGYFLDRYWRA